VVSGIRKGTLSEEDVRALRSQGLPGEMCDIGFELLAVKELDPDIFEEELKRLESQTKSLSSSASGRSESTGSVAAGGFPTIQGFRLDRELGRGGQASVYLGVEEATRRTVAIKVMTRRDAATVRLHEQEVHSLLGLRNDNILQVLSWRTEPLLCVITEYAEGGDLRKLLEERNGLDWESDGKRMARLIGEGVAYIHRKNLIHRDLKSENIFLDAKGEPKIGDFGLVKILSGPASGTSLVTGTITTHLGSGVGTPNYMAPEVMQVQFQLASDVWAYGLVVWEILSGRVPFHHLVTKRGQTTEGLFVELVALLDDHRKASKWGLLPVDDEWPGMALDIIQTVRDTITRTD
jgi:serine/threonine protein kinase